MIYLDHNATTPLDPRVRDRLVAVLGDPSLQGNPSSVHAWGQRARGLIERARRSLARAVGVEPQAVTFTSGGTEANNLALFGAMRALRGSARPCGILTSPLEHPSVLAPARRCAAEAEAEGAPLVLVAVDRQGRISPEGVAEALEAHPEVGILSLQAVNHELGNLYDIPAIAAAARRVRPRLVIHCDAVQALGKVAIDVAAWDVDLVSVSAHKIHGPRGIGALIHRRGVDVQALLFGGPQERGHRPGTEASALIDAFGLAVELATRELEARQRHVRALVERLRQRLVAAVDVVVHGDPERTIGNTLCVGFPGCEGQLLLINLDLEGIMVSTGSACSAGTVEASPVLLAIGAGEEAARSVLRISVGKDTREDEIDALVAALPRAIARVRGEAC